MPPIRSIILISRDQQPASTMYMRVCQQREGEETEDIRRECLKFVLTHTGGGGGKTEASPTHSCDASAECVRCLFCTEFS